MAIQYDKAGYEDMLHRVSAAASMVKMVAGVGNNTAYIMLYNAIDKIKSLPVYKQGIKRRVNQIDNAYKAYENHLLHAETNRFFDVRDLGEKQKAIYGDDFTNRDYFELWQGMNIHTVENHKSEIECLKHKYYKVLVRHDVKHAEEFQYAMLAMSALEISVVMYDSAVKSCYEGYGLKKAIAEIIFKPFCLEHIAKLWRDLLTELIPEVMKVKLDESEERDIEFGIKALEEKLCNIENMFNSVVATASEYGEFFRTKGMQKKVLREIAEMKAEADENIKNAV